MNAKRAVAVALLLICIGSAVGALVLYLQFLRPGLRYQVLLVLSGSMQPTIMEGNYILVDKSWDVSDIVAAPYPVGDVVAFHLYPGSDELIVHRAIGWYDNTTVITKGDNNTSPGPPPSGRMPVSQIIGKVVDYNFPMNYISSGFIVLLDTAIATGIAGTATLLVGRHKTRVESSPPPIPPATA